MDPTLKEMLHFHWENYQMRQSHFWRSLNRLILAVVTLWAVPFIKVSLFDDLQKFIIFFPVVAILLSLIGKSILKAEYGRLIAVIRKFDELTPATPIDYRLDFSKLGSGKIGKLVISTIGNGLIFISIFYFFLMIAILSGLIHHPGEK